MRITRGLCIQTTIVLVALVVSSGTVLAESKSPADPQAGFGVLLAMMAIVLAMLIARRKRQYLQQSS